MNNKIIFYGFVVGWLLSVAFCLFLSVENIFLRSELKTEKNNQLEISKLIISLKDSSVSSKKDWDIFNLEDVEFYRNQGKVDGKIEAMLIMGSAKTNIDKNQINKIIELAERSSSLEDNSQFLSLLCQAAFHRGLSVGQEESVKSSDDAYSDGYHKAMEDLSCPETGKMTIPSQKELDIKKPK
jgi:hypothetical protein